MTTNAASEMPIATEYEHGQRQYRVYLGYFCGAHELLGNQFLRCRIEEFDKTANYWRELGKVDEDVMPDLFGRYSVRYDTLNTSLANSVIANFPLRKGDLIDTLEQNSGRGWDAGTVQAPSLSLYPIGRLELSNFVTKIKKASGI
jgi:hypothetical protein